MKRFPILRRCMALTLAVMLTLSLSAPALAAASAPTCDETYYATLDPYGNLLESSVVKTYTTYGNERLVDYGAYDQVINLTDARTAQEGTDRVTFDLSGDVPGKFYFEGKTTQPYEEFPWKLSLSYALNGVPALAEELAGRTGVVEITLDAVPNRAASEYSRNNLTLMATSMFNGDDILSLEAPGAQVQLIGNLYCVIYAVLPGEEQHFTIRVGSEDFSYSGMVFLAVPATLEQLSQVADLREAKEEIEDSYDTISDSLDTLLDSLDGMSGSLNATAGGLDLLNSARGTVSSGKGEVYDKADAALASVNGMADALGALDQYNSTLSQAVTDLNGTLNGLNDTVQGLKPELENTRQTIAALQKDANDLKTLLTDVESYNKRGTAVASSLTDILEDMEDQTEDLQLRLYQLESALKNCEGVKPLETSDLLGLLSKEEAAQMKTVLEYRGQYEDYLRANKITQEELSFEAFIIGAAYQQYRAAVAEQVTAMLTAAGMPAEQIAPTVEGLLSPDATSDVLTGAGITDPATQAKVIAAQSQQNFVAATAISGQYVQQAKAASEAYDQFAAQMPMVETVNGKIEEVNDLVTGLTRPTGELVGSLAELCETLGDGGATNDLASLARLCRDLLRTMKKHEGEGAALVEDLNAMGDLAGRVTVTADTALEDMDGLVTVLNTYEPALQSAITDIHTLSASAQSALRDTTAVLGSAKELLGRAGPNLDEGTRQTLTGLSASLRKATTGLDETGAIRASKDAITGLVEEQWNTHTGEENNLLLMDPDAPPQSLTDSRNQGVTSIQYVMRSQEIKVSEEEKKEEKAAQAEEKTTLWDRIVAMFRDLWAAITSIF